jgi:hypothetical protein
MAHLSISSEAGLPSSTIDTITENYCVQRRKYSETSIYRFHPHVITEIPFIVVDSIYFSAGFYKTKIEQNVLLSANMLPRTKLTDNRMETLILKYGSIDGV